MEEIYEEQNSEGLDVAALSGDSAPPPHPFPDTAVLGVARGLGSQLGPTGTL